MKIFFTAIIKVLHQQHSTMSGKYRPQRKSAQICLANLRSTYTGVTPIDTEVEEDVASEDSDFKVPASDSTSSSSNASEAEVEDQELDEGLNEEPLSDSSNCGFVNVASPNEPDSRTHYTSEFARALSENVEVSGQKKPKDVVLDAFQSELQCVKHICRNAVHPFTFYPPDIHLSELDSYLSRQQLMFSQDSLEMVNPVHSSYCASIKEPFACVRIPLVRNLMFVGGYVKCLSWSPCFISDAHVQEDQPSFLAVSTFRSPATRPKYSDLTQPGPGVIQIFQCSGLSLCKGYILYAL
ncbi:unnamed protein product [Dibothriocephalus latus]|uniref:Uncharacterized protein n=1 Tax=Dibothriocephalus latus TaxID=60516 RepID=A0A3P7Q488_DIBLA|nr:unnamed protein product [Dibothriocephalus latus]